MNARPIEEWHEDMGPKLWWALGEDGEWLGEAPYVGSPLDCGQTVTDVVISSNVTLGEEKPEDTGVAVWFTWDGMQVCIAVDRYPKVQDNLQAIHHVVEARRTEVRHGGLHIARATFKGFQALPAPASKKPWRAVMGFSTFDGVSVAEVEARFKKLAKERHPDAPGGSHEAMTELSRAKEEALREIEK